MSESTESPASGADAAVDPAEAGAAALGRLLEPIASLALARGVKLPALIDQLKIAMVRAALADAPGAEPSDSRLAVMTGVHRKDLRRIRTTGRPNAPGGHSIATQVFARWRADPRFLTGRGQPRQLPRSAADPAAPSFDALVASITRDVHPRAVLDELLRLALVEPVRGDRLRLRQAAFVPASDDDAMLALAVDNLGDHAAAVAANLSRGGRRYLEQAVFSDELSAESAEAFNRETLAVWQQVFDRTLPLLRTLFERDRREDRLRDHRVRLGLYSYATRDPRETR